MRTTSLALLFLAALPARAEESFFEARIAPLLKERCLSCHQPDKSKGDLDLTSRAAMLNGGENGPAVVPGKPEQSLMVKMVTGAKPKMPRNGDPLTPEQAADLRRWIADGAAWPDNLRLVATAANRSGPDWWAYRPVARPPVPKVQNTTWGRTPIDGFILQKLEARGLTPAAEADRPSLIRRLTFDLHGLPPTPEEIDAFVNDKSTDAYEKLIDRLLASPRYGERWGRHWLDTVHFADTHGYDKDKRRPNAWPYRDYVIRAFSEDKPYSRFIREQLAGDVLYPNDPTGIVATGFIAAGPWDFVGHVELREGTVDKQITRLLDRDDMLSNTAATFLSLTVHCARCHDHKFDPITQKDYYRLQAVFAGVDRGDRPYMQTALPAEQKAALEKRRQEILARQVELTRKLHESAAPGLAQLDAALKETQDRLAKLPPAPAGKPSPTNGWHSQIAGRPEATVWVQVDLGQSLPLDEIRLYPARPTDFRDAPGFGFPVRFKIEVSNEPTFMQAVVIDEHSQADFPNPGDVPYAVRPKEKTARYVRVTATRFWKRLQDYVVAFAELEVDSGGKNVARGSRVTASESIEAGRWSTRHLVDGFSSRAELPDLADPKTGPVARQRLECQCRLGALERERLQKLAAADPATQAELKKTAAELVKIEEQLKAPAPQMTYTVLPHAPRPIHVLHRGNVTAPRDEVGPGALALVQALDPAFKPAKPEDEGARRAALAEWIADHRNPLTRRSLVNRVWHYHFGKGIVDTPNDFGFNGGRPSHPELLDWLAVEFLESGESLKKLHRLILTSSVYRQSSAPNAEHAKVDADNRLLWRMNRRRLDAESLRDAVLAVSGKLDLTMGGPGFDLFRFKDDHSPIYDYTTFDRTENPATYRRTVYRFVVRSVPNPFLECLDAADPNLSTPVRGTTNTALQALALLNDPFMVRQAEHFAARLTKIDGRPQQVAQAYRLALGRRPSEAEAAALTAYAERHGLAQMCRVLFNTNEFLFVD